MIEKEKKTLVNTILKYVVIYLLIIGTLYFKVVPIPFISSGAISDLLLITSLTLTTFFFASQLVHLLLIGGLVESASAALQGVGVSLAVWIILINPLSPDLVRSLSGFVLMEMILLVVFYTSTKLRGDHYLSLRIIVASTCLLGTGLVLALLLRGIPFAYSGELQFLSLTVGIVGAAINASQLLTNNSNPYLAFVGTHVNPGGKQYVIALFFFLYLFALRGFIVTSMKNNAPFFVFFEWMLTCLLAFALYKRYSPQLSQLVKSDAKPGWAKHEQILKKFSGKTLENWVQYTNGFIETGEKEMLYLMIVDTLQRNGVPLIKVQQTLTELANYREVPSDPFSFSWDKRKLDEKNVETRRRIMGEILDKIGVYSG